MIAPPVSTPPTQQRAVLGSLLLTGLITGLLAVSGSAQGAATAITVSKAVETIARAKTSVTLFAPTGLSNKLIERALVEAAYERGVRVNLVLASGVRQYTGSLANNVILAGANIRKPDQSTALGYEVSVPRSSQGFLLVDGVTAVVGNVGEGYAPLKSDASRAAALSTWTNSVLRSVKPVTAVQIEREILQRLRENR